MNRYEIRAEGKTTILYDKDLRLIVARGKSATVSTALRLVCNLANVGASATDKEELLGEQVDILVDCVPKEKLLECLPCMSDDLAAAVWIRLHRNTKG